jgi:type I restriction enzyme, S subunit
LELRRTSQYLSADGIARSRLLPSGTLIMSIAATVGLPIVTAIRACIHDGFVALERLKGVDQTYLLYALKSLEGELRSAGQMGSQSNVNTDIVKRLTISLPPEPEQRRIVEALRDADLQIASLQRLVAKKEAMRQGTMQQLLTGKVRLSGFSEPWREVALGRVVTYVKAVALSRAQLNMTSPLRYLHYGDIHTSRNVLLDAAHPSIPRAPIALAKAAGRLKVGDLVFVDASEDSGGVGKSVEITATPRGEVVPGLHTITARFDKGVLADGFKAYMQFIPAFRTALLRLAAGTKVLATTRSHISSVSLSLPGVEEQRQIAAVLRDCDMEIDVLHVRIAKSKAVKDGMMQELLTGRTRLPVADEAIAA